MKNLYKALACIGISIIGVWLTAKLLLPVGLPFLLGWLLAKLAAPATKRIAAHIKLPYSLISFVCLTLLAALILLLIWLCGQLAVQQLDHWGRRLPQFLSTLDAPLSSLRKRLLLFAKGLPDGFSSAASDWVEKLFNDSSILAEKASEWLLGFAGRIIAWLPDVFMFLLTMILSAYLFAAQGPNLRAFFEKHIPSEWLQRLALVKNRLRRALAGYLKAQLRLSLVTFGIVFLGLLFLKQKNAFWVALLTALVDALPVFGAGTVLLPWAIFSFLRGASGAALGLGVLYAVAAVLRAALEPRFLGKQIGLPSLLTLIALYSGFRFFGIVGMILFPIAAILTKQVYDLAKEV